MRRSRGGDSSNATKAELEVMRKLRVVLKRSSSGLGIAASFVGAFAGSKDELERDAVRKVMLGMPVEAAFSRVMDETSPSSSWELLRFVAALGRVSSTDASRAAERLTTMFERLVLLKQKRAMERSVMAFRGLIVSVVAGIVVGMLACVAPLISSFQVTLGTAPPAPSSFSPYEGALLLLPSAVCLGLMLSPGKPYVNALLALLAFAGVVYFVGPLATLGFAP